MRPKAGSHVFKRQLELPECMSERKLVLLDVRATILFDM